MNRINNELSVPDMGQIKIKSLEKKYNKEGFKKLSEQHFQTASKYFVFRYKNAQHWLDVFRTYYGPLHKAFLALDEVGRQGLEADVMALLHDFNRSGDATLVIPSEYLEVVIVKK